VMAATSIELTGGRPVVGSLYTGFAFWMWFASNSRRKAATSPEVHASSTSWLCGVIAPWGLAFSEWFIECDKTSDFDNL
jgi:hypothetical protein